jgi:transcriptional regulator with XRE-family HTH domain
VTNVTELREIRRRANLRQHECAALIGVPLNTFRMWDSGLRTIPRGVVERARLAVYRHLRDTELLTLDQLATETGVHQRTLRAAARTGRLTVQFSPRSAFGRPIRRATRRALIDFMARYYKKSYSRFALKPQSPVILVPTDYAPASGLSEPRLGSHRHNSRRGSVRPVGP